MIRGFGAANVSTGQKAGAAKLLAGRSTWLPKNAKEKMQSYH